MITQYDALISRLERQAGVVGALLVGVEDGMVIAGDAGPGRDSDTAAALAASLFRRARAAAGEAGLGNSTFIRLEAERGHLCATARGDVVAVAMAAPGINLGRLRLEMMSAMETI